MLNKAILSLIYCTAMSVIFFTHFGYRIIHYYADKKYYKELRLLFNQKVRQADTLDEKKYYMLLRNLILYRRYFKHLDLKGMISKYDPSLYNILWKEWSRIEIAESDIFLFYSVSYNMGIFLPTFLPIFFHIIKIIKCYRKLYTLGDGHVFRRV